MELISPYLESS